MILNALKGWGSLLRAVKFGGAQKKQTTTLPKI